MKISRLLFGFIIQAYLIIPFIIQSYASEPTKDPILRIENGTHTALIRRIGVDDENRFLVTSSDDKTARLFEISSGRLVKIFRPPIDEGNEGKLYSVAISPDGETIACGGWSGYTWEEIHYIYFFDRRTGRMKKRLTDLPNVINHLSFSKDGKFLAVSLGRNNGVRIYRTYDYTLEKEDNDYGAVSYGLDFSYDGRLVTASYDGFIRLYDKKFNLISKEKGQGGLQPFQVSFHPNGRKIAVGFVDTTKVEVLSGKDLSHLYFPDSSSFNSDNLSVVAWSYNGRNLYAGGMYYHNGKPIIKWDDEGKGSPVELLCGADDTIMHILPLKNGDIVFGTCDPYFGVLTPNGEKKVLVGSSNADFRDNFDGFKISYDGSVVQFGYKVWGESPCKFSIEDRNLELNPKFDPSLMLPITTSKKINITDWKYTYNPKLNGKELAIEQYEYSRSIAISPDGETFILGTDWRLRLFDAYGNEKWSVPGPGVAWGVNISGNGNVAVATFGDGTIRWFRMKDGKELLIFFPHNNQKSWVLWTPAGYYDASPGSDELIGWHLNNGKDKEADFYPVSRFRNVYYRPDVLSKILDTLDEEKALIAANKEAGRKQQVATDIKKMLPPIVTILSPENGTEISNSEVLVKIAIKNQSESPITAIKALIDGRPFSNQRGVLPSISKNNNIQEIKVNVPQKDFELAIIAENQFSASEPDVINLKWKGRVNTESNSILKPKLYLLSIGISRYENKELLLDYPAKDATDFANVMKTQKNRLYRDISVKLLTNEQATKGEILDGLDWIGKETTHRDVAMLFLAGHGLNDPRSGVYYFLPVNANLDKVMRTCVAFSDIKTTVESLAGKAVLFVDTCHSGNVMGNKTRGTVDINAFVNELTSAENGAVVFASSTGRQVSLENEKWKNGAFTKALVEGITGKADLLDKGKITINTLDVYISERVKELTSGKQTPTTNKPSTVPDFPIAVPIR
ncbi:MAG: caspase family protein [Desulfobacterales bacterium]|nr:caspase family protein [Desulfobacterales bacterium]